MERERADSVYGTKGWNGSSVEPRVGGMRGSVERYFTFNMGVSNWGYLFKVDCGIINVRRFGHMCCL